MKKFYIMETSLGKGIFAVRSIKRNEEILRFKGPIVTGKQGMKLDFERFGKRLGNSLQIKKDRYIYLEDPGRLVNHSCKPNSGIKEDKTLVAIRNIKKGEEIRYDYSTTIDEDDWSMKCKCGEKNCRKIIKDFRYLPKKIREKYLKLGIVQKFISKKFNKKPEDR